MIIQDQKGRTVGKVLDLGFSMEGDFSPISHILVKTLQVTKGEKERVSLLPWSRVNSLNAQAIIIKDNPRQTLVKAPPYFIGKNIMDQQIVDRQGYKLARVNDIKLKILDGKLRLVGIESGVRGLFLRLGSYRKLPKILGALGVKINENLILWDIIEKIDAKKGRVMLKISKDILRDLYNL
jgi:sporulation protein YlmC with PRC-barrel domain